MKITIFVNLTSFVSLSGLNLSNWHSLNILALGSHFLGFEFDIVITNNHKEIESH